MLFAAYYNKVVLCALLAQNKSLYSNDCLQVQQRFYSSLQFYHGLSVKLSPSPPLLCVPLTAAPSLTEH